MTYVRKMCTLLMYQIAITLGFISTLIYRKYFHLDNRQHSHSMWIVFTFPGLVLFGCCKSWHILLGMLIYFEGFMLSSIISYYTMEIIIIAICSYGAYMFSRRQQDTSESRNSIDHC